MRAEVDNFVREQEDRDNGLNNSATEVIKGLRTQYDILNTLNPQLELAESAVASFEKQISENTISIANNNAKIIEAYSSIDNALNSSAKILESFADRVNSIKLPEEIGKDAEPWGTNTEKNNPWTRDFQEKINFVTGVGYP